MKRFLPLFFSLLVVSASPAQGNPVPDRYIREFEDAVSRWLSAPDSLSEQRIVGFLASYGVSRSLISGDVVDLMGAHFSRFVPLLIDAQRIPHHGPQPSLQRWFREYANRAECDSMKVVLREWLVAPMTEEPFQAGMHITGPGAAEAAIFGARLRAAEELGNYRDEVSLPELRRMLAEHPGNPVLVTAIRGIEDPSRARILEQRKDRLVLHRSADEIDSVLVSWYDGLTRNDGVWVADRRAVGELWKSLEGSRIYDYHQPYSPRERASFNVRSLSLRFRDGSKGSLENVERWDWREDGHPSERIEIETDPLNRVLLTELERAHVAPALPRFVEEHVLVFVHPKEMEVIGRYEFEGIPENGDVAIRYPIASGPGMGRPQVEKAELRSANKYEPLPLEFEEDDEGGRLVLKPGKAYRYDLTIQYRQPLYEHSATYLVTTAKAWGEPLYHASFQVIADSSLGEPSFSMPLKKGYEESGARRYFYDAEPFWPEQDLVVTW